MSLNINFIRTRYFTLKGKYQSKKKLPFSQSEDEKIFKLVENHGLNWGQFSREFNGRDPISLKNRYYHLKKRQNSNNLEDIEFF